MKNNFKALRTYAGFKQIDVARRLGVKQTTVSMWETGCSLPRAEILSKIAEMYSCTVDELLGNQIEKTQQLSFAGQICANEVGQ